MITPRRTRLIRAPDLPSFQRAIAEAVFESDAASIRATAVLVPSRSAAAQLRRTLEHVWLSGLAGPASAALALPDFLTRAEWYDGMHHRLPAAPPMLSDLDREVLLRAAAREAVGAGAGPPFHLRPGLLVEMLAFYDALRRLHRTLEDFERLATRQFASGAEFDRGAARLLVQTRFLVAAFGAYERRVEEAPGLDEHALRAQLVSARLSPPLRRLVVTVADQAAGGDGLWPADFDLLTRLPGLECIDVVATERVLAAGFIERLHGSLLPGVEEVRRASVSPPPVLQVPPPPPGGESRVAFVSRDREEEVADFARRVRAEGARGEGLAAGRMALVFQRPLAYLYVAREIFGGAGIPYQAQDTLPLAAEPYAAAVDLVFSFVTSDFTRASTVALLRSPHFVFRHGGRALRARAVAALDAALAEARYLGGREPLEALASAWAADPRAGGRWRDRAEGAAVAAALAGALAPLREDGAAASRLDRLLEFLRRHERPWPPMAPDVDRHLRARAAVLGAIERLRDAFARHDAAPCPPGELISTIRRWIEGQTFSPRTGRDGLHLVDARAAAYGDFDAIHVLGLVDGEWPERPRRSIFYPSSLLADLGWPKDGDRLRGARAAFLDLLGLPRRRVSLSTFTLEDDAVVVPSTLLEDAGEARLPREELSPGPRARIFPWEALSQEPIVTAAAAGEAGAWLALRLSRTPAVDGRFHGQTRPVPDPVRHAVASIDTYLSCPFKYFARRVLRLGEEVEDEPVLTPQARGRVVHAVLHRFFAEWEAQGGGRIGPGDLEAALALFVRCADAELAALPEADRVVERARLVGSAAVPGLGERLLRLEVELDAEVLERLLEHEISGEFELAGEGRRAQVALKGIADRIDLLRDGTLRVIDYKTGRAPKKLGIQLQVYGACAEQALDGRHRRRWRFGEAGYVAFGERQLFVRVVPSREAPAFAAGQARFLQAVGDIARGDFRVQPEDPFLCTYCAYPTVCRKDYVGDE